MDLIDEDNLVYPELYYNPEKADEIKDIYDFIERGFAKETYIDFLKVSNRNKLKKNVMTFSDEKNKYRLFNGTNGELKMYAQFDEYASCFYIYPYDPNETAFKYTAPMFKLQELKSKHHYVLWNLGCELCDKRFEKNCNENHGIRQQLMYIEYFTQTKDDLKLNMMRVLIPSLDLNGERAIWCPSASKQKLTTIDLSNPDFFFKKVDYKMVENDQLPNDSIYIRTRFPDWYEQEKVYLLDFNGRVKKKSMRNFQLMRGNDSTEKKIIFQFGKVDKKTYILDYKEPFCEAQAFAIGLITYSWKENSEDK